MNYEINRGTVIFDGINSQDYGVWIKGSGVYSAPARRYSSITIPGRNGTLTIDEGAFEEVEHNYPAFIPENFTVNIRAFRNDLLSRAGYKRMTDSYHPDEYYRAKFMDGLEVTPAPRAIGGPLGPSLTRCLTRERAPQNKKMTQEKRIKPGAF